MSVARVVEVSATSTESFDAAIHTAVARAVKTLRNVQGAWVKEQKVYIEDGEIATYQVNLMITFVLEEDD